MNFDPADLGLGLGTGLENLQNQDQNYKTETNFVHHQIDNMRQH